MSKSEAQQVSNLTGCVIYLYSNGDHAAQESTKAAEHSKAGSTVTYVARPL